MSSSVSILRNMVSFDKAEQFDGFSKVVIIVSDEIEYSAGTETGRTLTLNCPWGTQEIANNILQSIKGFQYQPMTAENALVDPSVEIGDGVSANGVYSGVYSLETKFNSNLPTTVSAPADEELYEEHTYVPKSEREVTRKFLDFQSQFRIQDGKISAEVSERKSDVSSLNSKLTVQANQISTEIAERKSETSSLRSSIIQESNRITAEVQTRASETESLRSTMDIQAGQITAKVNKNDGNSSTFGWALETSSWRIFSGSNTVLKADKDGLEVKGVIRATSGEIGGFKITSNSLTYNSQTWGGTNSTGIYLGPQGIQCGSKENGVQITNNGYLYAENGEFRGSVRAGNIQYGGNAGYFNGGGISSSSILGDRMVANTISTAYTSSGINASLGRADAAYNICTGITTAQKFISQELTATGKASVGTLYIGGVSVTKKSATFKDGSGSYVTISYWG